MSDQAAALLFALRTVMGDAEHGQNMTWDERLMIGRRAIDAALGRDDAAPVPDDNGSDRAW